MAKNNAAVFWEPSLVKQALRGHNRIDTFRLTAPASEGTGAWISM
jgi:hypothetical protein